LKKLLALLIASTLSHSAMAVDFKSDFPVLADSSDNLIKVLEGFSATTTIKEIERIEEANLLSVVTSSNEIVYLTESGRFLLAGNLIDLQSGMNLTQQKEAELNRIDWNDLPWEHSFSTGPENAEYELAVFTDVDCPYCKRLEKTLEFMPNIKVHYFLYPLEQLHPNAPEKSKNILCSEDPVATMHAYMLNGVTPPTIEDIDAVCQTTLDGLLDFGQGKDIGGTPTLVFQNGNRIPGGPGNSAELMKMLEKAKADL